MSEATTILAIEDNYAHLYTLNSYLSRQGFEVLVASSATEALEILEKTDKVIKTIVLDWMMPDMNGIELLQRIKASRPLAQIPVIIQTGKSSPEEVAIAVEAGAFQHLAKPYSGKALVSMIDSALAEYERHQRVTPQPKSPEIEESVC